MCCGRREVASAPLIRSTHAVGLVCPLRFHGETKSRGLRYSVPIPVPQYQVWETTQAHRRMSEIDLAYAYRGVSIQKWGKNRLGEVAKEAFSLGVETTFPCEQITILGSYFINAAHRGAPSRKEISIPPNASLSLKKQTDLGAKRLEGTSWKANTPRPPPAEGRRTTAP